MDLPACHKITSKIPLSSSPKYTAPEVFLNPSPSGVKIDSWSLGMIIAEQLLGQPIWPGVKLSQCLRKVLSLILCDTSIFERLARENNSFLAYEVWICMIVIYLHYNYISYIFVLYRNYQEN